MLPTSVTAPSFRVIGAGRRWRRVHRRHRRPPRLARTACLEHRPVVARPAARACARVSAMTSSTPCRITSSPSSSSASAKSRWFQTTRLYSSTTSRAVRAGRSREHRQRVDLLDRRDAPSIRRRHSSRERAGSSSQPRTAITGKSSEERRRTGSAATPGRSRSRARRSRNAARRTRAAAPRRARRVPPSSGPADEIADVDRPGRQRGELEVDHREPARRGRTGCRRGCHRGPATRAR